MPISSPFIGACLLVGPRHDDHAAELKLLTRQLHDIEKARAPCPPQSDVGARRAWFEGLKQPLLQ